LSATYDRGYMRFCRKDTGDCVYTGIGSAGAGMYSIQLFKGDHDAYFQSVYEEYQDVFPHQSAMWLMDACTWR
ncbi:MAG: hypothetical protein JXR76_22265, partial [Deltaproteobacteria bacterium]|nr:hypothetical protein [Deltaproteobacteria bacterium]